MKKIKFFAMIDVGIMAILLFLTYITDYIQNHDTSIYAGLSTIGFWSVLFLLTFFIAAAILVLLLYIIISVHFINKSMKPLKIIAIIDGVIIIVSDIGLSVLNYFYSIRNFPTNWAVSLGFDVFSWGWIISLSILAFIAIVCISVLIIRKVKNKQ